VGLFYFQKRVMEFKFAPNVSQEQEVRAPSERLQQMVSEMHDRVKVSGSFSAGQFSPIDEDQYPPSPTMPKLMLVEQEEKKAEIPSEKNANKRLKTKPKSRMDWSAVFFWFYFLALTAGFAVLLYHAPVFGATGSTGSAQVAIFTISTLAHDTHSIDLDLHQDYAKPLLASLESSFYAHLSKSSAYACLCMHHLTVTSAAIVKPPGQFRICAVHNRYMDRVHLMINPRIIGHGNKTDLYEESYASAPAKRFQNVPRYRHVFIQWSDVETGDDLTLQLNHMQAVCMQVALDEMN
jgi:hypothetical protein